MIVYKHNKSFVTRKGKPNENFADPNMKGNVFVVDDCSDLAQKIINLFPYFNFVTDENGNLIDVVEYPNIQYTIDKTTISTTETATITITDPAEVSAVIDGQEYTVTDGTIEYSNENPGIHRIVLQAEGYYEASIKIEVMSV